jgi:hypothetical protein
MAETHSAPGSRPSGAPPYEPVVRLGMPLPPQPALSPGAIPSRVTHPVLLPDDTDVDDEMTVPQPVAVPAPVATPTTIVAPRPAPKVHWYAYAASGVAGAVLVTALYGLLGSRSSPSGNRAGSDSAPGGAAVADTALFDRRADTLALAISAFSMRANMYETRRMPCSGLARGLTQVEDAWLGYNMARKEMLTASDPGRDARDKSLYADVRTVEVRFERSSCKRP